jgi:predicted RNase H-like nuclease (RuvC/YqgF family)
MRLTPQQRLDNEAKIKAVMNRLLNGDMPPGGKADVKTLAREAGIDRSAFYGSRPYARLREEFEQRLRELDQAGEQPDPRDAQVTRLKDEIARLKERLAQSAATITELTDFRGQALARLAAQHDEITRLRHDLLRAATIRRLPAPAGTPPVKEPALP